MKNLKTLSTILFFAFSLIFISNVSFAQGTSGKADCSVINNQLDLLYSGYLNHPTTRKRMKGMSKNEAHEYKKAMRNKLNARFGADCFTGDVKDIGRPTCKETKKDVKRLFSGYINHPTNRTRQKQMTRNERKAWKQEILTSLKERYGKGCYN